MRRYSIQAYPADDRAGFLWACIGEIDEFPAPPLDSRYLTVAGEDRAICESLGDLAVSRSAEFLFNVDRDVLKARRLLSGAFLAQREGVRPLPGREALAYPISDPDRIQYQAPA